MMRPGYKTTEFWLSLVVVLLGYLNASGAFGPDSVIMKIAGHATSLLALLGYTWSRTSQKNAVVSIATPSSVSSSPAGSAPVEAVKTLDVPAAP